MNSKNHQRDPSALKTVLWVMSRFLLIVPAYFFAKMFADSWENLANTDFMTFWLAGKSLVMGFDAYDPTQWQYWSQFFGSTWIFNPRFIYPLPLRLFLAPLGLIPFENAYLVWTILSQYVVLFSVYLLYYRSRTQSNVSTFVFLVLGAVFFRPTYATLRFGQIGPWLLLSLVVAICLWEKDRRIVSGVVLALTILKPTIGGPYILLLALWFLLKKHWDALIGLAVGGIGLLILGMVQDPMWVFKFLESGNQKLGETFAYGPSVWGLARLVTQGQGIVFVGSILTIGLILAVVLFIRKHQNSLSFKEYVSLITPVVLVTTPYLWGYDQLYLLIPLSTLAITLEDRQSPFVLTASIFILATVLSFFLALPSNLFSHDYISVFLPLIILAILMALIAFRKNNLLG